MSDQDRALATTDVPPPNGADDPVSADQLASFLTSAEVTMIRQPRRRPRQRRQVLGLFAGCLLAIVGLGAAGTAVVIDVAWPRTATGTCFALEPGWCTSLTVRGVEQWGRVTLPPGAEVVESSSDDFWGKTAQALVRLPRGGTVALDPIYDLEHRPPGYDPAPLTRSGVRDIALLGAAQQDRWSYSVVSGTGRDGAQYVEITANWNA